MGSFSDLNIYSPDLTVVDFWLWPTVKLMIYRHIEATFAPVLRLKGAITFAFSFKRFKRQKFGRLIKAKTDLNVVYGQRVCKHKLSLVLFLINANLNS